MLLAQFLKLRYASKYSCICFPLFPPRLFFNPWQMDITVAFLLCKVMKAAVYSKHRSPCFYRLAYFVADFHSH